MFWSAERLAPLETYRFTVTRSDGRFSAATVTLPDSFPDPDLSTGLFTGSTQPPVQGILLQGIERLADLEVIYDVQGEDGGPVQRQSISYLNRIHPAAGGLIAGFTAYEDVRRRFRRTDCPRIVNVAVRVSAAGPGWLDFVGMDDETLALLGLVGHVEQGLGFLGGITSKHRPWPEVIPATEVHRIICLRQRGSPF